LKFKNKKNKRQTSIFQKIFLAYLIVGITVVILCGSFTFQSSKNFIKSNIQSNTAHYLDLTVDYFEQFYVNETEADLKLLAASPSIDQLLSSQKNEIFLTRPVVEKLLLHFTHTNKHKYITARFIDAKGMDRVITQGNKRLRNYQIYSNNLKNTLSAKISTLYDNLKKETLNSIIYEGPFLFEGHYTYLVGISKIEPEIGGFGGCVIFHVDLRNFFRYIKTIRYLDIPLVHILDQQGSIIAKPENIRFPLEHKTDILGSGEKNSYNIFKKIVVGIKKQPLFTIYLHVPHYIYQKVFYEAIKSYVVITFLILILVTMTAFYLSNRFTLPIKNLSKGIRQIVKGDLKTKLPINSSDEIGDLTKSFNDMMDHLHYTEKRLVFEALHDSLTNLPNRTLLFDRIQQQILLCKRHLNQHFAVLYIDLDRFKLINDSLGHIKGDRLLVQISQRLKDLKRNYDTIARIGGDEFIILMNNIKDLNESKLMARRVLAVIKPPFDLDDQELYITASIGIVYNNIDYLKPVEYLRDADNAMYRAKKLGKNRYQVFDKTMHEYVSEALKIESELRIALEKDEFVLHYQPIISLKNNKVVRLEALVRWQREGTLLYPKDFLHIAEDTGLIIELGRRVLRSVCQQHKEWKKMGISAPQISINFSAQQFEEHGLIKFIKETLSEFQIDPSMLCIEITESVAINDIQLTQTVLKELKMMGVQISLDDFGVGYSSLNSLLLIPIDILKIDRSFTSAIDKDERKAAIIKSIIVMANVLKFCVIAEGVETKLEMDFLKNCGCNEVQGYYFSHPLPTEKAEIYMKSYGSA